MQDNRRQLKGDRRGVAGLPLKLLVTMVVLCLAIPMITNAMESSERSATTNELNSEADRIRDAVAVVYYSGSDSMRSLEFDLPQECMLSVGGEGSDAYSIRCLIDDNVVSTKYFEKPIIGFEERIDIYGSCTLKVFCDSDNVMRMCLA